MSDFGAQDSQPWQQPGPQQWGPPQGNPFPGNPQPNYYGGPALGPVGSHRASFGQRFLGLFIDGLVSGLIILILAVLLVVVAVSQYETETGTCTDSEGQTAICETPTAATVGLWIALLGVYILLAWIVAFFLHIRPVYRTGQTVGRRVAGTKVVDVNDGSLLSGGRAFGRYLFASYISGSIFYLGYLWMLWDNEKQTLHDKVTNSTVIKT